MSDKCYICHEDRGILRKTCTNDKCKAKTHSLCLERQYITLKTCGFCKSDILINKKFNYGKFLFETVNLLLQVIIFVLHTYLIFTLIMGLNPLDPFDINFNDITIIERQDIYSTNYIIFAILSMFNFIIYMFSFLEDKLLKEPNDKYGKFGFILLAAFSEITFSLIIHVIGYNVFIIFSDVNMNFYTYKTFLIGTTSSLFILCIYLLSSVSYKYLIPSILEPFYDKQFGH